MSFAIPLFLGQLLQQFYNVADAWVVGNFADNDSFAAVSSAGSLTFLIIGFFNGIAIGGGVVISKYFGARDEKSVEVAIHTNFLFGLIASALSTIVGLILIPVLLRLMQTPENVLPASLLYLRVYFAGVSTIIMYNIGMSIMRALGDSLHPLYYLFISSVINVVLDLLFVAVFHWGVGGAAAATIIAQGVSAVMCVYRMCKMEGVARLDFKKLHYNGPMMHEVITQGLPTGIQNSVISIGNIVIQKISIHSAHLQWPVLVHIVSLRDLHFSRLPVCLWHFLHLSVKTLAQRSITVQRRVQYLELSQASLWQS